MASSSNASHGGSCFFKTITTFNIHKNQLRIPKMIGNQLLGYACATLEVPTGDEWEVQLERDSRGVVSFCHDGWRRFTEFYSISSGNFLHFEYKGCSDFLVLIYETAPTEIEYPFRNDGQESSVETEPADSLAMVICHVPLNTMDEEGHGIDSDDDTEIPFCSEHPFFQINISKSYLYASEVRVPVSFTNKHFFIKDVDRVKFEMGDKVWSVKFKVNTYAKFIGGWRKFVKENSVKLGDVCFFELISTSPEVRFKRIPKMIGNQLLGYACATLEVPTGDEWEVQLERDSRGVVSFCNNGWRRFTEFYSINSGNFLHFEYKGCSDFLVFIYETAPTEIEYPLRNNGQDSSDETEPANSLAMVIYNVPLNTMDEEGDGIDSDDDDTEIPFSSEHPFFKIKIKRSYLNISQVHVPASFTDKHFFIKDVDRVKFEMGDKVWSIKVNVYRYARFRGGWAKFVKENSVKLGDVCFFELISTSPEVRFKVTISRNF